MHGLLSTLSLWGSLKCFATATQALQPSASTRVSSPLATWPYSQCLMFRLFVMEVPTSGTSFYMIRGGLTSVTKNSRIQQLNILKSSLSLISHLMYVEVGEPVRLRLTLRLQHGEQVVCLVTRPASSRAHFPPDWHNSVLWSHITMGKACMAQLCPRKKKQVWWAAGQSLPLCPQSESAGTTVQRYICAALWQTPLPTISARSSP